MFDNFLFYFGGGIMKCIDCFKCKTVDECVLKENRQFILCTQDYDCLFPQILNCSHCVLVEKCDSTAKVAWPVNFTEDDKKNIAILYDEFLKKRK